ncbi:MAG: hypothetical protein Q8K32_09205 [Archangium sp.]|nr:hypothetical protein [Archangium sp.]
MSALDPRYVEWIAAYVAREKNFVRGKCAEATKEMVAAFPELTPAAGFVECHWGTDQHHWCVTATGEIVDPTASQFPFVFSYEAVDINDPATRERIPNGPCANCSGDCYGDNYTVCSEACGNAYVAYLNAECR